MVDYDVTKLLSLTFLGNQFLSGSLQAKLDVCAEVISKHEKFGKGC